MVFLTVDWPCAEVTGKRGKQMKSFKARVTAFWETFTKREDELRGLMRDRADSDKAMALAEKLLHIAFDTAYFELNMSDRGRPQLILTPEGSRMRLMQLYYWWRRAPFAVTGRWDIFCFKPGGNYKRIWMFDVSIDTKNCELYAALNSKAHKVDLVVHCPSIMKLEETDRYNIFFVFLDAVVSEFYTMEYIGAIDFVAERPERMELVPAEQLREFVDHAVAVGMWQKFENPCEIYSTYKYTPSDAEDRGLRDDVLIGMTSCPQLIADYYEGESRLWDEAYSNGVVFGFVYYENSTVPRRELVTFRSMLEDEIAAKVKSENIADMLGGATGQKYSYIDCAAYDVDALIPIATNALAEHSMLHAGFGWFKRDGEVIDFKIQQKLAKKA